MEKIIKYFLPAVLLLLSVNSKSQVKLAGIFSDNMVLQRGMPIKVWGRGNPGSEVIAVLQNEKRKTIVHKDSSWSFSLDKRNASDKPVFLLVSSGPNRLTIKNILIGDVWLCIGQSNMEFPMNKELHFDKELNNCNQPLIRFYNPAFAGKFAFGEPFPDSVALRLNSDDFYKGQWENCDSNSMRSMSAVAYYFANDITNQTKIPIGIFHLAIGGSPIETWMDKKLFVINKQFAGKISGNWLTNENLPLWIRQRGKENVGQSTVVLKDSAGPNHAFKPGFAYDAAIDPIISQPIKGILWYQGESNAQELQGLNEYAELFKLMMNDYRRKWKQPSLPVFYVQLSSIDSVKYKSQLWPQFRDVQRKIMTTVKNSGMAVSSDAGALNDVHPTNKKIIGERLARWALNRTYNKAIIPSGPLPAKAVYKNGSVIISFQNADKGLATSDGKLLRGFSVNGVEETTAKIRSNTVILDVLKNPGYVFYAWKPYTNANLVNSEKLPASTFKIKVEQNKK